MQFLNRRWQTAVYLLSILGLIISLWPNASSLYDLTGEEDLLPQLRGVMHWVNTAVRPQPRLAPNAEMAYETETIFGVNTFLEQEAEPIKRQQSLEMIRDAGFQFIRQEFVWEDIEIHGKGDFIDRRNDPNGVDAWAKYDQIVQLANENEIEIIARLSNPPNWTRALPVEQTGSKAPPDNFDDFGDFAALVVERYQGQVTYFQIWNEPNGNEEWGNHQPVNPVEFTALLCNAYGRIKAVNPDAIVLAGALTPTVDITDANLNDLIFLQKMYVSGAGECFDIMSAQGYGLWSGATDQRLRPTVINYPHHLLIRDVMVRQGDAHKPIWISEMAWNVVPDGIVPTFGRVTEEQQGRYGVEAYQRAQEDWPWMGVMSYWFFKRAADFEKDQSWYYFRLMEPDFTPLPAYDALSSYMNGGDFPSFKGNVGFMWMRLRPYLFWVSAGLLLFMTLMRTHPQES